MAQTESDISQLNLKEPDQLDWADYDVGGKYSPPPVPVDTDGKKRLIFSVGPLPRPTFTAYNELLVAVFDPIPIVGSEHEIRFYRVGVERWKDRKGEYINASPAGNLYKAVGLLVDPQSNAQYQAAFFACEGRVVQVTLDWRGYNKDTQETIPNYDAFPIDPTTGQKAVIVRQGMVYKDKLGKDQTVKAEVIFANAQVKRIVVPRE